MVLDDVTGTLGARKQLAAGVAVLDEIWSRLPLRAELTL
jgi:hypothetical protein